MKQLMDIIGTHTLRRFQRLLVHSPSIGLLSSFTWHMTRSLYRLHIIVASIMSSILPAAHEINVARSTFNLVGRDNFNYVNPLTEEILATLKPAERPWHTNRCMPGTRQIVFEEINDWLDDFNDDSKVMSSISYKSWGRFNNKHVSEHFVDLWKSRVW
jgi:hypothetical protein